ncbi:MAG: hypothetical protein PQJ59_17755 [Spirochaetales bacterium]|nr:hypothetical protein [Spirochaetales bacterium]
MSKLLKKCLLSLLFLLPTLLPAQEKSNNYYFFLLEDGQPHFNQIISWDAVQDALKYELIIKNKDDRVIYREESVLPSQEVSLDPGLYHYAVSVYNLLKKEEFQTNWVSMRIMKAEQPVIHSISPEKVYIEEENYTIKLKGEQLFEVTQYWLLDGKTGEVLTKLEDFSFPKEGEVEIRLPQEYRRPGVYSVKVINPGGMSGSAPQPYTIGYLKPYDITFSLGYNPCIPLSNSWFEQTWDQSFYPAGLLLRTDLIFLKSRFGYLGTELQGSGHYFLGGENGTDVEAFFWSGGLNLLYKYLLSPEIHLIMRLGGGLVYSHYALEYETTDGPSLESLDPYYTGGLSLQYYFNRFLFLEAGLDGKKIDFSTYDMIGIYPFVSVGLSY